MDSLFHKNAFLSKDSKIIYRIFCRINNIQNIKKIMKERKNAQVSLFNTDFNIYLSVYWLWSLNWSYKYSIW
ncbi:MAG: hypothetical protein QXR60_05440, partial [Candidatus Nanoarchaeia archaeon]